AACPAIPLSDESAQAQESRGQPPVKNRAIRLEIAIQARFIPDKDIQPRFRNKNETTSDSYREQLESVAISTNSQVLNTRIGTPNMLKMKFLDWYLKIGVVSALVGASMELFMIKTGFYDKVTVLESEKRAWENSPDAQAIREALNPWRQIDTEKTKKS
ncbi:hypothetical protein D0Y65_036577, partial [Glycine soja]